MTLSIRNRQTRIQSELPEQESGHSDPAGKLKPIPVQVGISDGASTQIISDILKEGDKIVIGQEGIAVSTNNQEVNPFLPRMGGGRR